MKAHRTIALTIGIVGSVGLVGSVAILENTAARADDYYPAPLPVSQLVEPSAAAADAPLVESGPADFGGTGPKLPPTQPPPFIQRDQIDDAKAAHKGAGKLDKPTVVEEADVRKGGKPLVVPSFTPVGKASNKAH